MNNLHKVTGVCVAPVILFCFVSIFYFYLTSALLLYDILFLCIRTLQRNNEILLIHKLLLINYLLINK